MRIGVIGTGTIASAVVTGIAEDGHQITLSKRSERHSAGLARSYSAIHVADNQQVLDKSDIIIIGLMADTALGVLAQLTFRPDHKVISLMADLTLAQVSDLVAPAQAEAVMIPFPAIAEGNSTILALGRRDLLAMLFGDRNTLFMLQSDRELSSYLAVQAVLSPVAKMVAVAAGWMENRVEDPKQAEAFLRLLVSSSLLASECAPLLKALDTPGGYNQRLRDHMIGAGMAEALRAGLDILDPPK